jgi:ribonuclease PH
VPIRIDGRAFDELRPVVFSTGYQRYAEGSVLVEFGETRVLCSASVEDNVPPFRKGTGSGWITAEYSLLPRSTLVRSPRESSRGRVGGRTHEIQRVIGRCLRSIANLDAFGERTVWVDCDVLQADGGTRSAAITGGYVALALATRKLREDGLITVEPLLTQVAGVSVGVIDGVAMLDLAYNEDFAAEVDFNIAMTGDGRFVEVQGNAEGKPFDRDRLEEMLGMAGKGIGELLELQREALKK